MFFLPYKLDHTKNGIAFFTIIVIAVCSFLFADQVKSTNDYVQKVTSFCADLTKRERAFLRDLDPSGSTEECVRLFESIRGTEKPQDELERLAAKAPVNKLFISREDSYQYTLGKLEGLYRSYDYQVPRLLTNDLAYDPSDRDVAKMFTSTFAHADIFHLVGNLIFFYIFSAAVELLIGSFLYVVFFITATVSTSLAYSYAMSGAAESIPTVGLSGVVMATLAALAVLSPFARIKCFLWFIILFKRFSLPALFIAAWYVGWDVYEMNRRGMSSGINYVAHISGALTGGMFALVIALAQKNKGSHRLST